MEKIYKCLWTNRGIFLDFTSKYSSGRPKTKTKTGFKLPPVHQPCRFGSDFLSAMEHVPPGTEPANKECQSHVSCMEVFYSAFA